MILNEIHCDICGCTVARIREGLFRNKIVVHNSYIEIPQHLSNGISGKAHICANCMESFVYKAIYEKAKEQSK
jgi:predicted PP-loop superfamily ATPase